MKGKKVAVLMSTYNGEDFVEEQIASILAQEKVAVTLFIRDDGSKDHTVSIIKKIGSPHIERIYQGENLGYGKSFFELVKSVPQNFDYYAFSDQDDYWLPEKLNQAIEKLEDMSEERKLYFSNLQVVDNELIFIKEKNFANMKISLGSAFVRNRTAGCTYVFNRNLFNLCRLYPIDGFSKMVEHDAIIYKLCLATNGGIYYDENSFILYRQHEYNVTGTNQGIKKRLKKELIDQFKNDYKKKLMQETARIMLGFLKTKEIKSESLTLLEQISKYDENFVNRLFLIFNKDMNSGVRLFDIKNKFEILMNIY
ncbi:glycosyltransferase family 2 protein [Enterococcus malodoratus]|uniref:Glycosyltransferase 2-like domain-containing protein n=1 Tax=Enterococcus malodoratus ATCC 43197 TaxID=1158601 RepID=R2R1D4_9ENTE|nr:glycosyltransferase family 2 protein [Enterococcus malodoratus]EOH77460.1 hypothetical protein UAI_02097 [Enterococcus malodoratus ATCC 43197]EOT64126.1 hypothetical protein I585_03323 [Enterococcus malodoratus ATCC 43197]OJG64320.1 hypothetical protein RV07_GL004293 [Enterococcus malodoratus]SPX00869.1 Glycosyltransferases involved in cell wall biogenesis [Enterococcus malodoratus]STD66182.1 Glycosyltransferases involved in cell wall biogenesis [Enterococcus malodoratus]